MGMWELILVFAIVLLFFGATRLPALGEGLGKALKNLKAAAGSAVKDEPPPRKELPEGERGGKGGGTPGA
jgi:sec-independent protein translocase protein TatA